MLLTEPELTEISNHILQNKDCELRRYDFNKYPADQYARFRNDFSSLSKEITCIEDAMRWKWGHWLKNNYPTAHQSLVQEIIVGWQQFILSENTRLPETTFNWWHQYFGRSTTFITAAFITHLVHHNTNFPIIDQHNFRSYNQYMSMVRTPRKAKKMPSSWTDIEALKSFMDEVIIKLPDVDFGTFDRYLMMFGQSIKIQHQRAA